MMRLHKLAASILLGSVALSTTFYPSTSFAGDPIPLKDLDGHFPFQPPDNLNAWQERSEEVRQQLRVALGIWPMPKLAKVQPIVHSTKEMDGYAIAKVYFESLPGFYVTGSLYLPRDGKPENTKRPGILCPHGHWDNGRFFLANPSDIKRELATGAERFESAAKNPLQARSVQLARMGCVVFLYDMIGYADSQQISFDRAHRFGLHGENPTAPENSWLLYSPKAEANMQSVMGLQTINSLQAFEFMAARADVDSNKIAVTGASGGGTQSFILAALEPRIAAAMPAVMVGTHMQGGCTCENACYLRINTGNVEIAATIAPRPLGLTTADDWTKNMAKDGFPELQKIYSLYGAEKKVELHQGLHFQHNYNHVSRVAMYGFINRAFNLGFPEPILERDFEFQTKDQLTVWNEQHPAPKSGIEFEAQLLKSWNDDQKEQLNGDPKIAQAGMGTILRFSEAVAKQLAPQSQTETQQNSKLVNIVRGDGTVTAQIALPESKISSLQILPPNTTINNDEETQTLLNAGTCLVSINDPLGQDLTDGLQPVVKNPRPAPAYTFGYNPTWMLRRTGVAIAALDYIAKHQELKSSIPLEVSGDDLILKDLLATARPKILNSDNASKAEKLPTAANFRSPSFVPGLELYRSTSN